MSNPYPESIPAHSPAKSDPKLWRQICGYPLVLAKLARDTLPTDIAVNDQLTGHVYGGWGVMNQTLERNPQAGQPLSRHGIMVTEQGRLALYGSVDAEIPTIDKVFDYAPTLDYPLPDSALLFSKDYPPTPDSVIGCTQIIIVETQEARAGFDAVAYALELFRLQIDAA